MSATLDISSFHSAFFWSRIHCLFPCVLLQRNANQAIPSANIDGIADRSSRPQSGSWLSLGRTRQGTVPGAPDPQELRSLKRREKSSLPPCILEVVPIVSIMSHTVKPCAGRAICCRRRRRSGTALRRPRERSLPATTSARFARPSLKTRASLPAAWAKRPTLSRRRCTRGRTGRGRRAKSRRSLTLRPENTAGVVRAYIEHKLGESGQLQKLYYIGPQFRRERPQKGRYRQFWQIGAEVIGPPSSRKRKPAARRRSIGDAGDAAR